MPGRIPTDNVRNGFPLRTQATFARFVTTAPGARASECR